MNLKIQFASLTVGPKAFCAKATTGWPEMYPRVDCEREIRKWLLPLAYLDVLDAFIALQQSKRSEFPNRATTWGDVIDYLARIKSTNTANVPGVVGVALWGFSIIREQETLADGN